MHVFSSRQREFLFKLYNNILGLNSRIHYINGQIDESCTFCTLSKNLPAPRETFAHLFWYCTVVSRIIGRFSQDYFRIEINLKRFFDGQFTNNETENMVEIFVLDTLKYVIWNFKLKKVLPTFLGVCEDVQYELATVTRLNPDIRHILTNSNIFKNNRE